MPFVKGMHIILYISTIVNEMGTFYPCSKEGMR